MPVRLSSSGLLWREWQESLLKKGGPPPPPSPENVSSGRSGRSLPPSCGEGDAPRRRCVRRKAREVSRQRQGDSADEQGFSFLCPALSPPSLRTICACPRHTFSATARKKLPEKGAFFMRCRFRTKRSQQRQGWRGGRDFRRRAATAVRTVPRSYRGRAPADNTRGGWEEGRGAMALLPRQQRPHGRRRP